MKIGFDAKRAYHNRTGLGNYSRTLIQGLSTYFPGNEYFLFNPKPSAYYKPLAANIHEIRPTGRIHKFFSAVWRSNWVKSDLRRMKVDLYHGLSNEIPVGIQGTGIPSVVTIHDLIFERYPNQFNSIDVKIYQRKYRNACKHANRIIAISNQTKADIVSFYGIDERKVDVCYQSCDPAFGKTYDKAFLDRIRAAYLLPDRFFLSVGSVIERKNLLNICKAIRLIEKDEMIPLVVIGSGDEYLREVKTYIQKERIQNRVIFLSELQPDDIFPLHKAENLAAVYQLSSGLVYPSVFEGFGIPVLEALWSGIPVITSNTSCLPEAGGKGAWYIDPNSAEEIAASMLEILKNGEQVKEKIMAGKLHALNFTLEKCSNDLMSIYRKTNPYA